MSFSLTTNHPPVRLRAGGSWVAGGTGTSRWLGESERVGSVVVQFDTEWGECG